MERFRALIKTPVSHRNHPNGPSQTYVAPHSVLQSPSSHFVPHTDESLDHTSPLVEKLAARFVVQPRLQDGKDVPLSRGGNPVRHQLVYQPVTPSYHCQCGHQCGPGNPTGKLEAMDEDSQTTVKKVLSRRDVPSSTSVLVLVWLINQREILKELTVLRAASVKEQAIMLRCQDMTHTHVVSLSQQLQTVDSYVQRMQQCNTSDMVFLKRLMLLLSVLQVVSILMMLDWGQRSEGNARNRILNMLKTLRKSVFRPTLNVFEDLKSLSLFALKKLSAGLASSRI